jgi:hypothetical protein
MYTHTCVTCKGTGKDTGQHVSSAAQWQYYLVGGNASAMSNRPWPRSQACVNAEDLLASGGTSQASVGQ